MTEVLMIIFDGKILYFMYFNASRFEHCFHYILTLIRNSKIYTLKPKVIISAQLTIYRH
jgi:hypothetical protein